MMRARFWIFAALWAVLGSTACTNGRVGDGGSIVGGEDAGVGDADDGSADLDASLGDLGCRERTPPPMPASWPFPATAEAYQAVFWTNLPNRAATCSQPGCHGDVAAVRAPFIPANAADLATPARLEVAIGELWMRALPWPVAEGGELPKLLGFHRPDGGPLAAPEMSAEQYAYLEQFLQLGLRCGWAPIAEADRVSGPPCDDAGVCACPIPATLDLSACAPSVSADAGLAVDGGM